MKIVSNIKECLNLKPLLTRFRRKEKPEKVNKSKSPLFAKFRVAPRLFSPKIYIPAPSEFMDFHYGHKTHLSQKDCANAIYYDCLDKLGRDFYYASAYDKNTKVLRFIGFASKKYLHGKLPFFAMALANPGLYLLPFGVGEDKKYFVMDTKDGVTIRKKKNLTEFEAKAPELDEQIYKNAKLDKSVHLTWSKQKETRQLTMIAACIALVMSLTAFVGNYMASQSQLKLAELRAQSIELEKSTGRLPNLVQIMSKVESTLQDSGTIAKVEYKNRHLDFEIRFGDSAKASVFQAKIGGGAKLEGTTVIYSTPNF